MQAAANLPWFFSRKPGKPARLTSARPMSMRLRRQTGGGLRNALEKALEIHALSWYGHRFTKRGSIFVEISGISLEF